jgi:hypothetical protein
VLEHQNADRKARRVGHQGPPPDRGVGRWAHILRDRVDAWWVGRNEPVSSGAALTTAPASANHGSNTARVEYSTATPSRSDAPTTSLEGGLSRYVPVGRRLRGTIPRGRPHQPGLLWVATRSFTADPCRFSGQRLRTGGGPDTCRSIPRMTSRSSPSWTSLLASGPSPSSGIVGPDDAERLPEGREPSPPGRSTVDEWPVRKVTPSLLDLSARYRVSTCVASASYSPLFPSPLGPAAAWTP